MDGHIHTHYSLSKNTSMVDHNIDFGRLLNLNDDVTTNNPAMPLTIYLLNLGGGEITSKQGWGRYF